MRLFNDLYGFERDQIVEIEANNLGDAINKAKNLDPFATVSPVNNVPDDNHKDFGDRHNELIEFMERTLHIYEESQRQTGRTSKLVLEANRTGAIIVCNNQQQASYIAQTFNVKTMTISKYLNNDFHRGVRIGSRKFLFDSVTQVELVQKKLAEAAAIMKKDFIGLDR